MREAWGKFDLETGAYHPLAHHSMDVAAVFARLLELPVLRTRVETAAGAVPVADSPRASCVRRSAWSGDLTEDMSVR